MSVVNNVPDERLVEGSHWRIESGGKDGNQQTRWRIQNAFIKETYVGNKVAVTMQKAWGGTSDSKYIKIRCQKIGVRRLLLM